MQHVGKVGELEALVIFSDYSVLHGSNPQGVRLTFVFCCVASEVFIDEDEMFSDTPVDESPEPWYAPSEYDTPTRFSNLITRLGISSCVGQRVVNVKRIRM